MKRIISIVLFGVIVTATILITACKWKESEESDRRISDEAQARILLSDARNQLKSGDFSGARETVKTMRKTYPYALSCRKAGILLMDSIELTAARHDTLHEDHEMRVRFYMKKLQHDLAASMKGK